MSESFRNYNYDYASVLKMVDISSTVNSEDARYTTIAQNVDSMKLMKYNYCMFMLDCRH